MMKSALLLLGVVLACANPDYTKRGDDWGDGQCSSRDRQSPINFFKDFDTAATGQFGFKYLRDPFPDNVTITNKEGRLQLVVPPGVGYLWLPDAGTEPFILREVSFRAQSEHVPRWMY